MDKKTSLLVLVLALLFVAGCTNNLEEQDKYKGPYDVIPEIGPAIRPLNENAVPVGYLNEDTAFYAGRDADGNPVEDIPIAITSEVLATGELYFEGYCQPCHGYAGYGDGVVAREGFQNIQSFHIERLREAPSGYFYEVITNGFGNMYSYASRIQPEDRWAVIAYVRALQLSQNASVDSLPEDVRAALDEATADAAAAPESTAEPMADTAMADTDMDMEADNGNGSE